MRTLLFVSIALCLAWPREDPDADVLFEADRAFCEATGERGLEGWLEWFAPDAVVLTVDGRLLSSAQEIRSYYASLAFPPPGFTWSPESAGLADSGELGWSVGSWELRPPGVSPEQAETLPSGRYLSIWKRQPDGSFRVVADSGGNPDFRTQLDEAEGPPLAWSTTTERLERAESGELAFAIGSWTARTEHRELQGKCLTVWKRAGENAWEIATEIGFDH